MSLKFLLDTNVISEVNKKIPNPFVLEKLSFHQNEVATASTVIHELLYGCLRLSSESAKRKYLEDYIEQISSKMSVFSYDLKAAQWHAQERARLTKIGKTPAFVDGQIASVAYCHGLILVTANVTDFQDFDGLEIENWFVKDSKDGV